MGKAIWEGGMVSSNECKDVGGRRGWWQLLVGFVGILG